MIDTSCPMVDLVADPFLKDHHYVVQICPGGCCDHMKVIRHENERVNGDSFLRAQSPEILSEYFPHLLNPKIKPLAIV